MNGLLEDIGGWFVGLVALGAVLLVGNVVLLLWHRLTKGRRQILSFVLVCHADDTPIWKGLVASAGESVQLNIDDLISRVFSGSGTEAVSELIKDRRASRRSTMSVIAAGNRVDSKQDAIGYGVASSRSSLSPAELSKSKAIVVQSPTSGGQSYRSYVVMIGTFPGKAPKLVLGD